MPAKNTLKKIAAKEAALGKDRADLATLKKQLAKEERAEKQRMERWLGRIAYAAGLHVFDEKQLQDAFENLEKEMHKKPQNVRHRNDGLVSEDEQVLTHAQSET